MKEQIRNTGVQTDKEEIGKLLEKEFRIMVVKMIKKTKTKTKKKTLKTKWRKCKSQLTKT